MDKYQQMENWENQYRLDHPHLENGYNKADILEWLAEKSVNIKLSLVDFSSNYVVFEYKDGELVQLSISLPTLEAARKYVEGWKSKKLYIYRFVE